MKRVIGSLLVAGCGLVGCGDGGRVDGPSIVLISLDTTRADRLGAYGGPATPVLDGIARRGVVFETAMTPTPVTLPAHTTLMTGLLPNRHGVRDNGLYVLPETVPTLAEWLADDGYDTRAVVAAAVLDRQYGLARGFEGYDDRVVSVGGLAAPQRTATQVTDAVLKSADAMRPPYFLFVHYFDAHAPYEPPARFRGPEVASPYDGEIAYLDHEVGRLLDGLTRAGLMEDTIVAVVADHGESLGEHDEPTHGVFLYQSTLRVPMIVEAPGRLPAGRRAEPLVSLADVGPTLLELAGREVPAGLDGRSMLPLAREDTVGVKWQERPLLLETETGFNAYGFAPLRGITDGRWKWIEAPRPELYHLADDPAETANVIDGHPEETERLREEWTRLHVEDRRAAPPGDPADAEQSEQLQRLASLGYVSASQRPQVDPATLPDPKDVVNTLALTNEARSRVTAGRYDEATATLLQVLDQTPGNLNAMVLLGISQTMAGRPDSAIPVLEQAAAIAPHMADVHFVMGSALLRSGNPSGAEAAWSRALDVSPRYLEAAVNLANLQLAGGHVASAARTLERVRAHDLEDPLVDYIEGRVLEATGHPEQAIVALDRASLGTLPPNIARDLTERLEQLRTARQ